MKTLIVKYTPRNERSVTNQLLRAFYSGTRQTEIEELDLCAHPPEFFSAASIEAYYLKNMMGQPLTASQKQSLARMHGLCTQLKSADVVFLAFPMYNFSMPGAIKAWFDSVLHVGETIDPSGGDYKGLMGGKNALVLVAAGGIYSEGNGKEPFFGPEWEHAVSLAKLELTFIGYSQVEGILGRRHGGPSSGRKRKGARCGRQRN